MITMGDGKLRVTPDPAHLGHYQMEIEAEVGLDVDFIGKALRSARYGLADFDEWRRTYLSADDPYFEIDVDVLTDCGDRSRLRMRRSQISEHELCRMKDYLLEVYCAIGQWFAAMRREHCRVPCSKTSGY